MCVVGIPLARLQYLVTLVHNLNLLTTRGCLVQGKRAVLPNTKIMLHQPSGAARGQAADIYNEARELLRLRTYMSTVLAQVHIIMAFNISKCTTVCFFMVRLVRRSRVCWLASSHHL